MQVYLQAAISRATAPHSISVVVYYCLYSRGSNVYCWSEAKVGRIRTE